MEVSLQAVVLELRPESELHSQAVVALCDAEGEAEDVELGVEVMWMSGGGCEGGLMVQLVHQMTVALGASVVLTGPAVLLLE